MFALAYFFFIPGIVFVVLGVVIVRVAGAKKGLPPEKQTDEKEDRDIC
ncbi:MAG: hypothetical protein K4571_15050 [Deltaproteobacteria bacterium]